MPENGTSDTTKRPRWFAAGAAPLAAPPRRLGVPTRPCLYTRLSYSPDGSVEKVERQEADGRAMGGRLGWPDFCCVYVDNSRSAWQRNRKRPDWNRMLATMDATEASLIPGDAKADHVHDGIMTYHGDRLIRQPFDLELLLNLADTRQIPLASVSGVRDLSNPDDRYILRIEAAAACRSSDETSRRVTRGRLANAQKGRQRPGGRRTFGWGLPTGETRKVIDPETDDVRTVEVLDYDAVVADEVKYLKEAGELTLAGMSVRGALQWINRRTLTSGGRPWTSRGLKTALTAYRMAGLVEKNGDLYEAVWAPVYADDRETALEMVEALRAIFSANLDEYGYHGSTRKHFLTGIAECSDCHALTAEEPEGGTCPTNPLTCRRPHQTFSRKPINGTHYYYCTRCNRGRTQANLDAYINGRVLRLLASPAFARALEKQRERKEATRPNYAAEIAALRARKSATEQQLRQLADHPNLDPVLLVQAITSFDEKIAALREKEGTAARTGLLGRLTGISAQAWDAEDVAVRSEALQMLYRVIVYRSTQRGPGFDASTVKLVRQRDRRIEATRQGHLIPVG
ncbi:recombinase family protein [Streptomyces sp. NPDC091281]|uniref:recombinase family protein n=1 Tax=Streptomyces sp. NPDC091281 TaxID=3365985 RepID=UPI0037FB2275